MFEQSDKIVCINAKGLKEVAFLFTDLPVEGQMYVVRDMDFHPETLVPDGIPGVLLVGIFGCDWYQTGSEYCFSAKRFVPLEEYREHRKDYIKSLNKEPFPEVEIEREEDEVRELAYC